MAKKPTYEELEQRVKELEKQVFERQQAEEVLRESEKKYRKLFDESIDGIALADAETGILIDCNKSLSELVGREKSELIGKHQKILHTHDEKGGKVSKTFEQHRTGKEGNVLETQVVTKTGEIKEVEIKANDLHLKDMRVLQGIFRDITERKRAEEALRESEEKYRTLFENANEAIYVAQDGRIKFPNPKTEEVYSYSAEELSSRPFTDFIHEEDREMVLGRYKKRLRGEVIPSIYPFRIINRAEDTKWVEINVTPFSWDNRPAALCFLTDITERIKADEALRESEEKLFRSKKMESLGLLAGGVAHDLNNVLSGIVSYPELILMDLPEDSKLRKPIETMQESGHRAVAIVQDLLTVARGVATTKEPLNLNDLAGDYFNSPEFKKLEQFHPTVTVKTNLDTDLLNVRGSHVHIRKVVMNLVSNASEAIEGVGNVTISTMNRYIDRPLRGYDDVDIGEYAVLSVSDDGSGISSDDLEKIFEPFYTKKVMGRSGTGLGLAVVWNVIQDHKGYIDVTSDENGTIFELYFPITREKISGKDLSIPIKDYKGEGETILVVDDVESQREISCKMLDALGYKTKAVSSGEEAVEYLKENTVDLILLDMIMDPGINGRETYERVIKIHPNQKTIIVSGFAETDNVKDTLKLGAGQYLKKPYTLEKIGIAIKEEFDK